MQAFQSWPDIYIFLDVYRYMRRYECVSVIENQFWKLKLITYSGMFFALYKGGPQVFIWGILIIYIDTMLQTASITEMVSAVLITDV